jgi:hypothetical protein
MRGLVLLVIAGHVERENLLKSQGPVRKLGGEPNSWRPYLASVAGALLALGVTNAASADNTSELLDARTVLGEIKKNAPASAPKDSASGKLIAEIRRFGNFTLLWNTVAQLKARSDEAPHEESLYTLRKSASRYDQRQAELPAELRTRVQQYEALMRELPGAHDLSYPALVVGRHPLLIAIASLLGDDALLSE